MSLCNWEVRQQKQARSHYLILNGEFQIDWGIPLWELGPSRQLARFLYGEHSPEGVQVAAMVNFRFGIFSSEPPKDL